jgi:hypothetical protein
MGRALEGWKAGRHPKDVVDKVEAGYFMTSGNGK